MIFRFKINEVNGSDSSLGVTTINYLNLAVKLLINDVVVFDEVDVSSFTGWTGSNAINSDIIVKQIDLIGDVITMKIDTINIGTRLNCSILIEKDNYVPYQRSFNLFGYDIGNDIESTNNAGLPINQNINFDFVLIPEEYKDNPYTYFTVVQKPFSNTYFIYNLSSSTGNIHYYLDDEFLSSTNSGFICVSKDIFDIKGINSLNNINSELILRVNAILRKPEFYIKNECVDCLGDCISLQNNPKAVIEFYDNTKSFYINDNISIGFDNFSINWILYDVTGDIIETFSYDVFNIPNINYYNSSDYGFNYTILTKGDFIIEARLRFHNQFECIKNIQIKGCDTFEIDINNVCDNLILRNLSSSVAIVNLYKFDSNTKQFSIFINSYEYENYSENEINSIADGIYKFEVNQDNNIKNFIVPVFCKLIACYKDYLNDIITTTQIELTEQKQYKFNVFSMLYNTYFYLLNKYGYFKNNISTLPNTIDVDIEMLALIEESLYKYCKNCQPIINNNCGCG